MPDNQFDTTHSSVCWSWGPRHYECALREIERLRAEIKVWEALFEQAASGHATYAEDQARNTTLASDIGLQ